MNIKGATAALNIGVIILGVTAWAQTAPLASLNALHIAALFGILAYSLMWVHYITGWLTDRFWPGQDPGIQYQISRWAILIMFLSHPPLIYLGLANLGLGPPPGSVQQYVGTSGMLFLICGVVGIIPIILFEAKKWLTARGVWHLVVHANAVAMVLIAVHGFGLGSITKTRWFLAVWTFYAVTLIAVITGNYLRKYAQDPTKRAAAIGLCAILAAVVGWVSITQWVPDNSGTTVADKPNNAGAGSDSADAGSGDGAGGEADVTAATLAEKVGTGGAECWVAIDGTVYDASNNPSWAGGSHAQSGGQAKCGQDLTALLDQSPHGARVLGVLPVVGNLVS